MSEAATESADVLLKPCDVTPCDVIGCPSPPACGSPNQKEDVESLRDCRKPEQQKHCNQVQPKKRAKAKGKLVRTMAVCEESLPFEASQDANIPPSCHDNERTCCKEEEQDNSSDPKKHSLSKESSVEYTDSTGIDLHQFIVDTLNSNPRDRMMLLKLEQDMIDFIPNNSPFKKFPHMSSYHRMLVHRVAAYFGMEHNVDQTGKSVIINRTSNTRIPEKRFLDQVHKDKSEEIHQWKIILKRDNSSDEQPGCTQESTHEETRTVEEYNPYAETQRRRQLFRGSRDNSGSSWTGSSRQSSTETDCRYSNDPRPWSSTDSDSSYQWTSPAPKPRQAANHGWDPRASGSISLFRLPSACPHPSSSPVMDEPAPNSAYIMENGIPPGSILVNPHTGQPFLNPDGTPAVYNPPDSQQPIRSQTQLQGSASQQQLPVYYYGQYPTSAQLPCRPGSPIQHIHSQATQPAAGYVPAVGVQQSSHTQAQAVLGTYSPMTPHQRSIAQGGVSVSFPQSKVGVGGEGGYCCVVPPPSHHGSCHPASCTNLSAPAWSAQY